jgi:hypothetical protein
VVHADNAGLHCAETAALFLVPNFLCRARHPPYSSDLASSDFWLFPYLQEGLQVSSCDEPDGVLTAIQEILREANRETLDVIFQECMI